MHPNTAPIAALAAATLAMVLAACQPASRSAHWAPER